MWGRACICIQNLYTENKLVSLAYKQPSVGHHSYAPRARLTPRLAKSSRLDGISFPPKKIRKADTVDQSSPYLPFRKPFVINSVLAIARHVVCPVSGPNETMLHSGSAFLKSVVNKSDTLLSTDNIAPAAAHVDL